MHSVKFINVHGVKMFDIWEAGLGETRTETGKARPERKARAKLETHNPHVSNLSMTQTAKRFH